MTMSFGLINVGATFQHAMDIAFRGIINESVVIYLDELTIFSKHRSDHFQHLKVVFKRCRKMRISLNPKSDFFAVTKGKLLGCIVSKDGIMIDLERIQIIKSLLPPNSKKALQSFMGKINFVKRFIPRFSKIVKPLQDLVKKTIVFKWGYPQKQYFDTIKQAIVDSPALINPNFSKEFLLYTFVIDSAYVVVLTQKAD